jgi:hypothetical protein
VDAAPQLQELWLGTEYIFGPEQLACLTGLRSLSSLEPRVTAGAAPALRSLTALQGLTHLSLEGEQPDELLAAVGQLAGLVSLEVMSLDGDAALHPLAALQRLTSLIFKGYGCIIEGQEAQVLAGLGQLRRLVADFEGPAAAAAAGLARLEDCQVERLFSQGRALVKATGQLSTCRACLAGFDLSSVHILQLEGYSQDEGEALRQQLSRCPQLRALRLDQASFQPEALQAIAALPQLPHLCLRAGPDGTQPDCSSLAVLAGGSRWLRQLTLMGMADLAESTLVALMAGLPQLRLLRLLGCSAALSQERCQALVGQLQLYELQVDVVVDNGTARAQWMMQRLEERWREA